MPPEDAFDAMSIIGIEAPGRTAYSVVCDLWTEEEGRSDLSLELTLIESGGGLTVELDDIHVL